MIDIQRRTWSCRSGFPPTSLKKVLQRYNTFNDNKNILMILLHETMYWFLSFYQRKNVRLVKLRCGSKALEMATLYGGTMIQRSLTIPVWHEFQLILNPTTCGRSAMIITTATTTLTCILPSSCARYTFVIFGFKWTIRRRWQVLK